MRFRLLAGVVAAGGLTASMLLAPGVVSADPRGEIGKKGNTCVLEPGADCRGVKEKWTASHNGYAKQANLSNAKLPGADFRGMNAPKAKLNNANLNHAQMNGVKLSKGKLKSTSLKHSQLRGADLSGAKFGPVKKAKSKGRQLRANPKCGKKCRGANLEFADLSDADLSDADLTDANLEWSNLSDADLSDADLTDANLQFADLMGADLIDADLTGANLCKARMPDGSVNSNC